MSGQNILDRPRQGQFANFAADFGTRFLVTVDTEEEFDWTAPISRTGNGVSAVPKIQDFQNFCRQHAVVPLYLVDHLVATSPEAAEILKPAAKCGQAEIGLHLHPWVNPPFDEAVSQHNSYAGNLSPELERQKFLHLLQTIETNLEIRPTIYRAGRYGTGPNTAALLKDAGFLIDSSVRSSFDYRKDGGPDYRNHPLPPYWLDKDRSLLELPVTTVFWGLLRRFGPALYPLSGHVRYLQALLTRTGLLERIPLTPEGVNVNEAIRAIDIAIDDALPVLVFSFHSPSLAPGNTPYVRSEADLKRFYEWWEQILSHLGKRGIASTTVSEITQSLSLATAPGPS